MVLLLAPVFNVIFVYLLHVLSLTSLGSKQKVQMAELIVSNLYAWKKKKYILKAVKLLVRWKLVSGFTSVWLLDEHMVYFIWQPVCTYWEKQMYGLIMFQNLFQRQQGLSYWFWCAFCSSCWSINLHQEGKPMFDMHNNSL